MKYSNRKAIRGFMLCSACGKNTEVSNPRLEELDRLMPEICKALNKKGMTTLQQ